MKREPQFFRVTDAAIGDPRVPRATGSGFTLRDDPCPVCGSRWQHYVGEGTYTIERGTTWTDAVGVNTRHPPFLVSQRVVEGLKGIQASGFDVLPVRITQVSSKELRGLPAPMYFYLSVTGRIDVDDVASGQGSMTRCAYCQGNIEGTIVEARRFVPILESWDGADVFKIGPRRMWGMLFCTRRVLELARRDRWTNFRFEPMDVEQRHATRWAGIDYLGPEWPPKQWYPEPPSTGKSEDAWLEELKSEDHSVFLAAHTALWDLGVAAVPGLLELLNDPSEAVRKRSARVIGLIYVDAGAIPGNIRERIRPLVSENLASKLDRMGQ